MELYQAMMSAILGLALALYWVWASGRWWLVNRVFVAGGMTVLVIAVCYFVVAG